MQNERSTIVHEGRRETEGKQLFLKLALLYFIIYLKCQKSTPDVNLFLFNNIQRAGKTAAIYRNYTSIEVTGTISV